MGEPDVAREKKPEFVEVRLGSVWIGRPLPYDLFLRVDRKAVHFRKKGDVLTADRAKGLSDFRRNALLVPQDQHAQYLESLKRMVKDPDADLATKGKFIKESAFIHINDLFQKKDVEAVVKDSIHLVEDMVSFVSSDVAALSTLMGLSTHDYYTYNHSVDVAVYAIALGKRILGDDQKLLTLAGLGGLLHDIGKRRIDWNLINKQGSLTEAEWAELKKHPEYGGAILNDIPSIPKEAKRVVVEHHENFDGTGYPHKLSGEDISKLTRVVSIADVFDALTTNRSYHKAVPPNEALSIMFGMQPGKFDPQIFRAFNKNLAKSSVELPEDFDPCTPQALKKS